jgi:hypothetical protein
MGSPYRAADPTPPPEPKSGELVYRPEERNDRVSGGSAGLRSFGLPTIAGAIVSKFWMWELGLVTFAVLLGGSLYLGRKRPKNVVVLRVADGELSIVPMGRSETTFRVRLDALDDVVLETKEVQRVMDVGASAVNIGMGPLSPNIAGATDTNRIALEPAEGAPFALTTEFFGHADTLEQYGKIRTFLRKMGWTPLSEREEADEDDDSFEP